MKINNRYLIETPSGFQDFTGVRKSTSNGLIVNFRDGELSCTKEHLIQVGDSFIEAQELKVNQNINGRIIESIIEDIKGLEYFDPVEVQGDNTYISEGLVHHNCLIIDEAAFIRSTVWDEFTDAIFPSQSGLAWKKNIIISTANGMNHYYHMIKNARENPNSGVKVFEVDWKDVPRYKSDGSQYTNEEFMSSIISKHGSVYFNQNYSNQFMGSSHTLITAEKLANMTPVTPDSIRDNKLNIFKFPEKNHKYIMSVDPSKDGRDAFAVQIVDITDYTFEQVASAKLQIDYLRMPEFIDEWCRYYNTAHLIIENNEGAGQSIADQLFLDYDYPNLYHDRENLKSRKNKKYPGFRTTTKTRTQILKTLKLFIENDKLKLHCKDTITEFYSFIQINNKFQADDGAMDDMIMALAIVFAPFTSARNFEDMSELIKNIYSEETEENFVDFADLMSIGSFDDYTDESVTISGTGDVLGFY